MVSERYITLYTVGKIKESEIDKIEDIMNKEKKEKEKLKQKKTKR